LGVIMAVGLVLRLWQINALGYNSDEAVYAGQAAAIAGTPVLKDMFPIFRAHPLIFPFLLSLGFRLTFSDLLGRLLVVAFGIGTIYMTYHTGGLLYNRRVGLFAALLLALMPYHIIVTRQVLLDGPMVFFVTLTLYTVARYALTQHGPWLWAAGVAMGLTFLTKETGIVLLGGIYIFLALSPAIKVRLRDLLISVACMVLVIAPHPIALALAGTTKTAGQYLLWQLFRRPNHTWDFYLTTTPYAVGPLVIVAALLSLWLMRRERSWREFLLGGWIITPILFFQFWPVKGFQYLLPTAPAFAILAARLIMGWAPAWAADAKRRLQGWVRPLVAVALAVSLLIPSWQAVQTVNAETFLAGSGGVPGGREAGLWIRGNVPLDATFLAIGPSMANIIQFYGYRRAYGLSVSTNPLRRNPVYVPVENPDRTLRSGEIQYVVYDVFSASRSKMFGEALLTYVKRFNGRVVHTESVSVPNGDGTTTLKPVIVIYEVRP
jgi:4-amino-4-deoxy-L-arabinose transferase-like glycosyltransferase